MLFSNTHKILFSSLLLVSSFYATSDTTQNNQEGLSKADSVIVKDGDTIITREDAQNIIKAMGFSQKRQLVGQQERLKSYLLGEVTLLKMSNAAKKAGIGDNPGIKQKIAKATRNILAIALVNEQRQKVKIDADLEELAKEKYQVNIARYTSKEEIKVAHILLRTKKGSDDKKLEEVKQKAISVLEEIKGGLDFAEAAKKYSEDPSNAKAGGVIDFYPHGRMVPEFEKASFALKENGEMTGLVKTSFGYHIIKLLDRKPKKAKPFEAVKEGIILDIKNDLIKEQLIEYKSTFEPGKDATIYMPALNKLSQELDQDVTNMLKNLGASTLK